MRDLDQTANPLPCFCIAAAVAGCITPLRADVLYDNGRPNGVGAPSNATENAFGARRTLLDDFIVPEGETWRLMVFRHNHVWGTPGGGAIGTGMQLEIWTNHEGEPLHPDFDLVVTDYEEIATGGLFFSREEKESWTTIAPVDLGPGHYWFDGTVVGPENNFWLQADDQNSEPWVDYSDFDGLVPSRFVFGGPRELSFVLEGTVVEPLRFTFPGGAPERIRPCGDSVRLNITAPMGAALDPASPRLHYDVGSGFESVPLVPVSLAVYDVVFPPTECGSAIDYYVSAQTAAGVTFTDPPAGATKSASTSSATAIVTVFEDDGETDPGWTVVNEGAVGGWERGTPIGGRHENGQREPAEDFDGSGQCWVTGLAPFQPLSMGTSHLISPVLNLGGGRDALVSYARWFTDGFEQRRSDVHISNDGGKTWVSVERPSWRAWWEHRTIRASSILPASHQMRLRFTATDAADYIEAGVDAVRVLSVMCDVGFPGDLDEDGDVEFADLLILLAAWGPCEPPMDCPADLDGSGVVDFGDLVLLLAAWQPCGN